MPWPVVGFYPFGEPRVTGFIPSGSILHVDNPTPPKAMWDYLYLKELKSSKNTHYTPTRLWKMEGEQQWLINCLNATLDTDQKVRSFAETSLHQASLQSGFGTALSRVAANRELSLGLPAVLLKQFISKHWKEDEESFEHPVVSSEEKEMIRRLLLASIDDPHRKICTAVSMAVAAVARFDWPEDWPDLLPFILKLINDKSNANAVHGALRCLALLSSDFDDKTVPSLVPVLFPCLHTIVSSHQLYDKSLRTKAFSVLYYFISILGSMTGVYQAETTALMSESLQLWMDQFSDVLSDPVPSEDPDDWSIRMQVLKCLNQFLQNFPTLMETHFTVILGPLWQTTVSSLGVYEQASIKGLEDSFDGRYDSDGSENSLESFAIQLLETLLTIVGSKRFRKVVAHNIKELVYYTIAFMQMTEQQALTWSVDANQYVADEDDNTCSCRVSGAFLIEEVITSFGTVGIDAVLDSARRRFNESQMEKLSGDASWWRIREATLYALATVSEQLLEAEDSGVTKLKDLLEQIFAEDMTNGGHEYPFLQARVFSAVPKFVSVINSKVAEHYLSTCIRAVGMDVHPPVKVGACRALSQLLPDINNEMLQPHMSALFSSLTDLLNHASDETMHLVLETLRAAAIAGRNVLASMEHILSPIILNLWTSHVSDPFIGIDALDVLEAIKDAPGCIHPLVSRVLPFTTPILTKPHQQPDGLVSGSLDLLTMLSKNASKDVVRAIAEVSFSPIARIVLQSDDHTEMQNATQCLASLISSGKEELLTWCGDSGFAMRTLLDVASRLLDPDLESSGSLFVGSFVLQLILHLPSQMAQHFRDLVIALLRRMQSCEIAGLRSSLLLIFARMVHMSLPNVGNFIDLLVSIPVNGYGNSFSYLMSEWTKLQGELQGVYQIKVTTTALALLLSSMHAELGRINVQGHLVKILALLADAMLEIQEQVDEDNEDSDWEDVQAGDNGIDEGPLYSAGVSSHSRPTYEYLDAMAKVLEEDDDCEDELLSGADPVNEINLVNYLVDFFVKFSQSDGLVFNNLLQNLTAAQQTVIKRVLNP
ncbi:OLC1v1032456C3 [Oldenlandia corymbosa var. corymbosa]|uniref:OLC1v1032456C3 n=1 Tax=Oldenlandia corymbosa var. corymbosa TaxID=529605 RepID=A0AAV1CPA4_OLDCO|nr:OLC1v1032456C3 [Oldenlandia corymbosa var. corymbosa]